MTRPEILSILQDRYGEFIIEITEETDLTIHIQGHDVINILSFLKETGFNFLTDLTAVDNLNLGGYERFVVVYHLLSHEHEQRLVVKAYIPEKKPVIPSVVSLWKTADWQEREVYDLFGIEFSGHPNLIRIMNPDEFKGHPLRKDFPRQGKGERRNFPVVEGLKKGNHS